VIRVIAGTDAYRIAIAELPVSARASDDAAGAVVVVGGDRDWCAGARAASRAGAAAVVVSRPARVDADAVRALLADVGELPVLIERPWLRPDAIADVLAGRRVDGDAEPPSLVAVDCVASASAFDPVLRDAVGWLRVLSGGPPNLRATSEGLAHFDALQPDSAPAVLTAVRVLDGGDRLHVHALGALRSEVDASEAGAAVSTTTARGRVVAPERRESHERLTLRRAIEAAETGAPTTDLAELAADARLAAEVARGIRRS